MEWPFSNFTPIYTALLLPLIFLILLKKWKTSKTNNTSLKLPPGPKKLPIIGDLHHLSGLPFRSFRDLSNQYGPIMHLKLGQVSAIVVSSPEIAKKIMKDHDPVFANRPESISIKIMWYDYLDISFSPYGDYWRQMRRICIVELLSAKMVRLFSSITRDEVSRMAEDIRLSRGKPIDLTKRIFSAMSSVTSRAVFGKVCKDIDELVRLMKKGLELAAGFEIADLFPSSRMISAVSLSRMRLVMMRPRLDAIFDHVIREHEENLAKMVKEGRRGNGEYGNEDVLDVFLRIKENGELEFPICNDNIKAVIHDLFAGGTDTSSSTIDWTMVELLRNPPVMAKAQTELRQVFKGAENIQEKDVQNLKYLKLVLKEVLRLHPPVPIIPRASREEHEIEGYTIPAKVKILVNNWAMQRDPKYWTNPESFDPERFENENVDFVGGDFQYLPFGGGRRVCPGITFCLTNIELTLAQILHSFDWELPDGIKAEDLSMTENHGITCSRKEHLFVVATPYDQSQA